MLQLSALVLAACWPAPAAAQGEEWGVVLDCGSSGTRVHVYHCPGRPGAVKRH
jgi:hypothetical protein